MDKCSCSVRFFLVSFGVQTANCKELFNYVSSLQWRRIMITKGNLGSELHRDISAGTRLQVVSFYFCTCTLYFWCHASIYNHDSWGIMFNFSELLLCILNWRISFGKLTFHILKVLFLTVSVVKMGNRPWLDLVEARLLIWTNLNIIYTSI